MCLLIFFLAAQTLSFAEADYSEFENNSATRMLQIDKRGTNVGVITVTIMFLSLDQFESEGGDPSGLDIGDAVPAQSMLTLCMSNSRYVLSLSLLHTVQVMPTMIQQH